MHIGNRRILSPNAYLYAWFVYLADPSKSWQLVRRVTFRKEEPHISVSRPVPLPTYVTISAKYPAI